MTAYGNRGKALESLVIRSNRVYRERGIAVIEKQATEFLPLRDPRTGRVRSVKVEHKSTVDFLGRFSERPVAFDCKHVSRTKTQRADRIRWDVVQPHQAMFLNDWAGPGGSMARTFILVSFDLKRFFVASWPWWAFNLSLASVHQGPPTLTLEAIEQEMTASPWPAVVEVGQQGQIPVHYLDGLQRLSLAFYEFGK